MADQIEEVPGGSNANNYANIDLIVDIAGIWNNNICVLQNHIAQIELLLPV